MRFVQKLVKSRSVFDQAKLSAEIKKLEEKLADQSVWNDQEKARNLTKELHKNKVSLKRVNDLSTSLDDVETLLELCQESGGEDGVEDLEEEFQSLTTTLEQAELATYLTGPYDANNCILAIHPGAGGTESCDWAAMLLRMFTRWAEREGFTVQELDFLAGDQAGVKNVVLLIKGDYAYGYLQGERGVHRLVRISPFDASARRHTSFTSVDVYPEVESDTEVDIKPDDLRIDTFRASSAGGQHVNTTDSAVRITHLPSGIVTSCQNERSQHANKTVAMRVLRARLVEEKLRKQEEEMAKLKGEKKEIGWGSQIRSYVMQPYTMVKDHRTNHETSSVDKVLDGEITPFMRAYLNWKSS